MELNQIQLFVLLAEHQNFSKAAETYHISQSAVSKQISLLEHELGGKLFERDTRQVRISERGYTFLPYAKQIVALEQEARVSVEEVNQNTAKRIFSVHIDDSLFSGPMSAGYHRLILRAIYLLNREYPNLKIKTHVFPQNEWRAQMKFQQFHVALLRIPETHINEPIMNMLRQTKIHTIRQFLVIHNSQHFDSVEDAADVITTLFQDQSISIRDSVARFILKVKPTMRIIDCENWNDLYFEVLSNRAATIVPDNMLSLFSDMEDISLLPLENMNMEEHLCVLSRPDVPEDMLASFTNMLSALFSR